MKTLTLGIILLCEDHQVALGQINHCLYFLYVFSKFLWIWWFFFYLLTLLKIYTYPTKVNTSWNSYATKLVLLKRIFVITSNFAKSCSKCRRQDSATCPTYICIKFVYVLISKSSHYQLLWTSQGEKWLSERHVHWPSKFI